MSPEDFCRWLQGFVEISGESGPPTQVQWDRIVEHLQHVFVKVTGKAPTKEQESELVKAIRGLDTGTRIC